MSKTGDNCPISTEGLRLLVALLDSEALGAGLRTQPAGYSTFALMEMQAEQKLIGERLEAAFGVPVESADVKSLALEVMA